MAEGNTLLYCLRPFGVVPVFIILRSSSSPVTFAWTSVSNLFCSLSNSIRTLRPSSNLG
jgi:hypothetical protein